MKDISHLLSFYFPPDFTRQVNPLYESLINYGRKFSGSGVINAKVHSEKYQLTGLMDIVYHPTSTATGPGRARKHAPQNVFVMSVADYSIDMTAPLSCFTGPLINMPACNYLWYGLYIQIFAYLWQAQYTERETILRLQVMNGSYPVTLPFKPQFVHKLLQHYHEHFQNIQEPVEEVVIPGKFTPKQTSFL